MLDTFYACVLSAMIPNMTIEQTTHFGYEEVPTADKARRVAGVFSSVANQYDIMNDVMSFGIHRLWKKLALIHGGFRKGHRVLDLAGGTGDLAIKLAPIVGATGEVVLADINASMLQVAQQRLMDNGTINTIRIVQADAQQLPFPDHHFDRIIMGFGLRNVTDKQQALNSMYNKLTPGGRLLILEFSKPVVPGLNTLYDFYSFKCLPKFGEWIANDSQSYQYLAESIRKHPDQDTLKDMLLQAGFDQCRYHNLTGGIVALHIGTKY